MLRSTEVWKATGRGKLGTTEGFIIPVVRKHMVGAPRVRARKESRGFGAFDWWFARRVASRFLSGGVLSDEALHSRSQLFYLPSPAPTVSFPLSPSEFVILSEKNLFRASGVSTFILYFSGKPSH